ncbi:MAG TPA: hypothetical protein PLP58_19900 [Prosthecobacter sp.]|nr:hypothetical protein [Prosthecobacter sp.]
MLEYRPSEGIVQAFHGFIDVQFSSFPGHPAAFLPSAPEGGSGAGVIVGAGLE